MFPHLSALIETVRTDVRVAVVYPGDDASLQAAVAARRLGIVRPVLVGPRADLESLAIEHAIDLSGMEIVDTPNEPAICAMKAIDMVRAGTADLLMKGSLSTSTLLSRILGQSQALEIPRRLSHLYLFDLPAFHKLLAVTDCGVNVLPTLEHKREILVNAVSFMHSLGVERPKVAVTAAVEVVNPNISATVDAAALSVMAVRGQIPTAFVDGPLAFDNAISTTAADGKSVRSVVAGDPDVLLVPDLNSGNMLAKSFKYMGGGECAGLILGARATIILTSRADSTLARIASMAVAARIAVR